MMMELSFWLREVSVCRLIFNNCHRIKISTIIEKYFMIIDKRYYDGK